MLKRVSVKTRGIRGIARWCISWCGPSFRRTIERKKEREGSGPEDKCLPTRSRPPFYQGSRSSRFNERKSGREKEMGRERERERGSRHAGTTGPAKMQVHVHVVCTSTRILARRSVPAADRDRGNRDRDWDLKCYMNVCTYVGAIGRSLARSLAGPCNPRVHMCAYGIARSHPPFLVKEPRLSPVFYPTASFVI